MKKVLTSILALTTLVIMLFSTSACSFIKPTGDMGNLPDSNTVSKDVVINTQYGESPENDGRVELNLIDAVAKVKNSAASVYTETSSASAVLIDVDDGVKGNDNIVYMLTCHHVIEGGGVINVAIPDQNFRYDNPAYLYGGMIGASSTSNPLITTPYDLTDPDVSLEKAVTLVGSDNASDIAVLKLDLNKRTKSGAIRSLSELTLAKVAPSYYKERMGETVFSIGNPTGYMPGTVCAGIVSYLEREVTVESRDMVLTQIDAPTNPGVSGGGLYNLYGELIGITNAGNTSYNSINFSIPMSLSTLDAEGIDNGFVNIASNLIASYNSMDGVNYGYVSGRKEKLGFSITKGQYGDSEYVYIVSVTEGSLAERVGLKADDVIEGLAINGEAKDVATFEKFVAAMDTLKIGDEIKITVSRKLNMHLTDTKTFTFIRKQYIFQDTGVYPNAD